MSAVETGSWVRPMAGQSVSGDLCLVGATRQGVACALLDVLGHGPTAAECAGRAGALWASRMLDDDPAAILRMLHEGLLHDVGMAAAVACVDGGTGNARFAALGNVAAHVVGGRTVELVARDGTVGIAWRSPFVQDVALSRGNVLVMHSDGVHGRFELARMGLLRRSCQEIAETVVSLFGSHHDDASCLVVRMATDEAREPQGTRYP